MREELIEKKLEFEEIDVSKTPEKWKEVEKLSGGDRITPVLVNPDGSVEIGFRGIGCNYNS
jgi:glutaredoxin|tara:strand:- start:246 stop:428 length:183 start_codon:yes stop_codon:yes gene_type:complete